MAGRRPRRDGRRSVPRGGGLAGASQSAASGTGDSDRQDDPAWLGGSARPRGSARPDDTGSGGSPGPNADPEAVARQICLRLLTAAPRTRAQLAAALRRRGVPEEAANAVLARFTEVKLIDDAMFARAWVDSRHHGRGLAGRALGAELRQRGVSSDDIAAALSELDPDRELATARELVERRLAATAGMPTPARMRRLAGVLARKGYSAGLAYRVVREALERETGDGHVPGDLEFDLDEIPAPGDEQVPADG